MTALSTIKCFQTLILYWHWLGSPPILLVVDNTVYNTIGHLAASSINANALKSYTLVLAFDATGCSHSVLLVGGKCLRYNKNTITKRYNSRNKDKFNDRPSSSVGCLG